MVLWQNVRCADPRHENFGKLGNVLIQGNKCLGFFEHIMPATNKPVQVLDGKGNWLSPAFMDLFSAGICPEIPSEESAATLQQAALAGGFADVCLHPARNVFPARIVNWAGLRTLLANSPVRFHFNAAGLDENGRIADIFRLSDAGAPAFSNGFENIKNPYDFLQLLRYVKATGKKLFQLPDCPELHPDGQMHEGKISAELGIKGIPRISEIIGLQRDLTICKAEKFSCIWGPLGTEAGLKYTDEIKTSGGSCFTSVMHLFFSEENVDHFSGAHKIFPPLRTENDRKALIKAVESKQIPIVASGHHPWSDEEKMRPFTECKFGAATLGAAVPAMLELYNREEIRLETLIYSMAIYPREVMNLQIPGFCEGDEASYCLFSTEELTQPEDLQALPFFHACPWDEPLRGRVLGIMISGQFI